MAEDAGHHGLPVHEVVLLLQSHAHRGLSATEATARLARFGPNTLAPPRGSGPLRKMARQVHDPLIYVLLAAAATTAALGAWIDSGVILAVVVLNATIGYLQETKAEAALAGLRSMMQARTRVVRDGRELIVASEELVPGDLVVLSPGDRVAADLRLTWVEGLRLDESPLTGESVPVSKEEVVLPPAAPVGDRRNMAYSGTSVVAGRGSGVVVGTGAGTELGEIHRLVGAADSLATPLTRKLAAFSRVLTGLILGLAALAYAVGLMRGQAAADTFTAAVALAVGAIPEGLPAAVTITLAIGVGRMARRRAVVRRLPVVETLGSTTVVCSDKTGTLTENRMTVRAVWTPAGSYAVTGAGPDASGVLEDAMGHRVAVADDESLRWTLVAGAACNDAELTVRDELAETTGDPTEAALLVAAWKGGVDPRELAADLPRVATLPFGPDCPRMATLHRAGGQAGHGEGGGEESHLVLVKGAVERVLDVCREQLDAVGGAAPLDRDAAAAAADALAGRGLRVLAVAVGRVDGTTAARFTTDPLPATLALAGLQAMHDPPRPAARSAVAACRRAGIVVKMVTGDHAATARAVASQVGILEDTAGGRDRPGAVLTGADLSALAPAELVAAVDRAQVLARISPAQKLRLVEALQARGHVVAMSGDGVNDAPALRQADIGVAMGRSGTDVARDAADMVLVDDDFATIEAAVEEGRGVFDNLTKFIAWTLPTNIGEGMVILVAVLAGTTVPILPTQILWINMTTAVLLGPTLAFEAKEDGIMARPPRPPDRPLLTAPMLAQTLLVAGLLVAGSWWVFAWERSGGANLAEARTAAVNLFVVVAALYLFSCRSFTLPAWRVGVAGNRWVVVGIALQALAQLGLTYLPVMNTVFHTAPLGVEVWTRVVAVALVIGVVVAGDNAVRRRRGRRSESRS